MTDNRAIGFIGVGRMGEPMARRLQAAGHQLFVTDIHPHAASSLVTQGARFLSSPAAIAKNVEIIFTSLPGPRELEQVVFGEQGILNGIQPGTVFVDLGTNPIDLLLRVEQALHQVSGMMIAAPVTKGVGAAIAGDLTVFVGGVNEQSAVIMPLLETIGSQIFSLPDIRSAVVCKLLTNLLWYSHATILGEAIAMGAAAGLDTAHILDVITASSGTSWTAENSAQGLPEGDYDRSFNLALCCKDLQITMATAESLGLDLKVSTLVTQRYQDARHTFGDDAGEMSVVRLYES